MDFKFGGKDYTATIGFAYLCITFLLMTVGVEPALGVCNI
jgi:hypothetical protein